MINGYRYFGEGIPAIGADETALEKRLMELEAKGYLCEAEDIMIEGERYGYRIRMYVKNWILLTNEVTFTSHLIFIAKITSLIIAKKPKTIF